MNNQHFSYFEFNGKKYPYITIDINDDDFPYYIVVSVHSLSEKLFDEKGFYVSNSAELLDNKIAYYVDTEDDLLLPPNKILKQIYV